jgi:transposase-like protein
MDERNATREELKRELATARAGGKFFPREVKERALAYAEGRLKTGLTVSAVARELGIKAGTLMFWQKGAAKKPAAIRRVVLRPAAVRSYSVVGGHGVRVDDLSLDEVAALFERLA